MPSMSTQPVEEYPKQPTELCQWCERTTRTTKRKLCGECTCRFSLLRVGKTYIFDGKPWAWTLKVRIDPNQPTVNTIPSAAPIVVYKDGDGKHKERTSYDYVLNTCQFTDASDQFVYSPATFREECDRFIPHRVFTKGLKNRPRWSACLLRKQLDCETPRFSNKPHLLWCVIAKPLKKYTSFPPKELGWVVPSFTIEYDAVGEVRVVPRQREIYKLCNRHHCPCWQKRTLVWKQPTVWVAKGRDKEDQKQCGFCKFDFRDEKYPCPFLQSAPLPLRVIVHESQWVTPTFTTVPKHLRNVGRVKSDVLGENGFSQVFNRVSKEWCPHCFEYVFHHTTETAER